MWSFLTNKGEKERWFGFCCSLLIVNRGFSLPKQLRPGFDMPGINSLFNTCCNYEEGDIKGRMNKFISFVRFLMKGRLLRNAHLFPPSTGGCVHIHLGSIGKLDPTGNILWLCVHKGLLLSQSGKSTLHNRLLYGCRVEGGCWGLSQQSPAESTDSSPIHHSTHTYTHIGTIYPHTQFSISTQPHVYIFDCNRIPLRHGWTSSSKQQRCSQSPSIFQINFTNGGWRGGWKAFDKPWDKQELI